MLIGRSVRAPPCSMSSDQAGVTVSEMSVSAPSTAVASVPQNTAAATAKTTPTIAHSIISIPSSSIMSRLKSFTDISPWSGCEPPVRRRRGIKQARCQLAKSEIGVSYTTFEINKIQGESHTTCVKDDVENARKCRCAGSLEGNALLRMKRPAQILSEWSDHFRFRGRFVTRPVKEGSVVGVRRGSWMWWHGEIKSIRSRSPPEGFEGRTPSTGEAFSCSTASFWCERNFGRRVAEF